MNRKDLKDPIVPIVPIVARTEEPKKEEKGLTSLRGPLTSLEISELVALLSDLAGALATHNHAWSHVLKQQFDRMKSRLVREG